MRFPMIVLLFVVMLFLSALTTPASACGHRAERVAARGHWFPGKLVVRGAKSIVFAPGHGFRGCRACR